MLSLSPLPGNINATWEITGRERTEEEWQALTEEAMEARGKVGSHLSLPLRKGASSSSRCHLLLNIFNMPSLGGNDVTFIEVQENSIHQLLYPR